MIFSLGKKVIDIVDSYPDAFVMVKLTGDRVKGKRIKQQLLFVLLTEDKQVTELCNCLRVKSILLIGGFIDNKVFCHSGTILIIDAVIFFTALQMMVSKLKHSGFQFQDGKNVLSTVQMVFQQVNAGR